MTLEAQYAKVVRNPKIVTETEQLLKKLDRWSRDHVSLSAEELLAFNKGDNGPHD